MINYVIAIIMTISSVTSAILAIVNNFKKVSGDSKKAIDTYIVKQVNPYFEDFKKSICSIESDISSLKEDIAESKNDNDKKYMQSLRYECLCFASDVRKGIAKTREEYEEIFRMEDTYNTLIEKHNVKNGYMKEEMAYVHRQYQALNSLQMIQK